MLNTNGWVNVCYTHLKSMSTLSGDAFEQLVIELLAQFDHLTLTNVAEKAHRKHVPIIVVS